MIYDFDDGSKTTCVGSVHEEDDAPNFYQPPLCRFDISLCHCIAICDEVSDELCVCEGLVWIYFVDRRSF